MINKELIAYITDARNKGTDPEIIKSGLILNGWSANDIAEAYNTLPHIPLTPPAPTIPSNTETPTVAQPKITTNQKNELLGRIAWILIGLIWIVGLSIFFLRTSFAVTNLPFVILMPLGFISSVVYNLPIYYTGGVFVVSIIVGILLLKKEKGVALGLIGTTCVALILWFIFILPKHTLLQTEKITNTEQQVKQKRGDQQAFDLYTQDLTVINGVHRIVKIYGIGWEQPRVFFQLDNGRTVHYAKYETLVGTWHTHEEELAKQDLQKKILDFFDKNIVNTTDVTVVLEPYENRDNSDRYSSYVLGPTTADKSELYPNVDILWDGKSVIDYIPQ